MRLWWWAYALVPVLTFSITYLLFDRSLTPDRPLAVIAAPAQPSLTQISEQPVTDKDQARLQDPDSAPAALKQDQLPAQKEARLDNASRPEAAEASSPSDTA
jgi:hypothetical protein